MSFLVSGLFPFLSLVAAALPTVGYVLLVWWIDRYEKEPIKLLAITFLWGAVPAVLASCMIEVAFDTPLVALSGRDSQLLSASVIAPPVEEFLKGLALLGIYWLARYQFDGVLDGIIYGSLVGFGFAMTENVLYFWDNQGDGLVAWSVIVLGRAVVFGFNHAMFTSLTGVGFGLARYTKSRPKRWGIIGFGLLAAITTHFFHNVFVSAGNLCVVSFIFDWLGVLVVFLIVLLAWRRERTWMETQLADEVASGVLNPWHYEVVTSWRKRFQLSWQAVGVSGLRQARLWRKLVDSATRLAFRKHQQAVMAGARANDASANVYVRKIAEERASIVQIRQQLGDEAVLDSTVCARCGRPSPAAKGAVCAHCGAPWLGKAEE